MNIKQSLALIRSRNVIHQFREYVKDNQSLVDIGAGGMGISKVLKESGFKVISIDVQNKSRFPGLSPIIYDGRKLPFKNNEFDVALLLFVLHHTNNPEEVLKETIRVSRQLIIMEDIYDSILGKYKTFFIDNLLSWQFGKNPHSNKKDVEWQVLFRNLGLKLENRKYFNSFLLNHVVYNLRK